ncbi:Phosphoglycerol transferase I [Citrobacter freundii]|uniref:Phosphoglycerol transferase I n=1 Tax=Citrobacter freundii TaxID=546 RepID=A0A7G2IH82_CITFR|nr:Phosphoglycerol transferase I [Citrobacter freundii]
MQLPGTDYTIAGMVASQCGIPLFAPFEGNASASVSSFFPNNICLGDILKKLRLSELLCAGCQPALCRQRRVPEISRL